MISHQGNMVYALASSGFLPGDVEIANNTYRGALALPRYAEESLYSFELGSKKPVPTKTPCK